MKNALHTAHTTAGRGARDILPARASFYVCKPSKHQTGGGPSLLLAPTYPALTPSGAWVVFSSPRLTHARTHEPRLPMAFRDRNRAVGSRSRTSPTSLGLRAGGFWVA